MGQRIRRLHGRLALTALGMVVAVVPASQLVVTANAANRATVATANANFIGTWAASAGGWVIKTENLSTGACTGTSDYTGYTLTDCLVTGNSYKFTINYGPTYHSYNSGSINGNTVEGSFDDTNGTAETYTATRLCVVPKLKGAKLVAAKTALAHAHCAVGKVTKSKSATVAAGRVISTRPGANTQHHAGTKISLSVSRGKH